MPSSSHNYKCALEAAVVDRCDFAVVLGVDVRECRHLRHNLTSFPQLRRDQCDYFSLFILDLIASPWQRYELHLAKPLFSGPDRSRIKCRLWG